MERVDWVCALCLRLAERAAHPVTMTRHDMLAIRWKADHREQPGAHYHGQRITSYSEWKTKDTVSNGDWRAVLVLANGERLELVEA
jgi:hypothetical protein